MVRPGIFTVCGSTGKQGLGIVDALLQSEQWKNSVRGLTRKMDSPRAQELAKRGCEMVQADFTNPESMLKAFGGSTTAFVLTDFYDDSTSKLGEVKLGTLVVEAAMKAGVQHIIFSGLVDIEKATGGKYYVDHFTDKYKVAEKVKTMGFPCWNIVQPGFYLSNMFTFIKPRKLDDGTLEYVLPCKSSTKVPVLDIADMGPIVKKIASNPEEFNQKIIPIAKEYMSFQDLADGLGEALGCTVRVRQCDKAEAKKLGFSDEWIDMFRVFEEFDYYGTKANFSIANELNPNMKTWKEYLKTIDIRSELKDVLAPSSEKKA